jgi:hypothetical protein
VNRFAVAASLLSLTFALPLHAKPKYQVPGEWLTSMQYEVDGKPLGDGPEVAHKCMSVADIEEVERHLFQPYDVGCTSKHEESSHRVKWAYQCPGKTPASGHGEMVFGVDGYEGVSINLAQVKAEGPMRHRETRVKFKGTRVGDCKQDPAAAKKPKKDNNQEKSPPAAVAPPDRA